MMMRALAALGFALVLLGTQPAFADEASVTAEIQARYDALGQILTAKDWDAMRAMEAPGYLSIDVDGKVVTGEEEIAQVQNLPAMDDKVSKTSVVSLQLEGDTAFVEQRVDLSFTQADANGRKHRIDVHALSSDVWKRIDGQWLIFKTTTNQIDMALDGTNFKHEQRTAA
jgi:ketosteroid isomerase-like protein